MTLCSIQVITIGDAGDIAPTHRTLTEPCVVTAAVPQAMPGVTEVSPSDHPFAGLNRTRTSVTIRTSQRGAATGPDDNSQMRRLETMFKVVLTTILAIGVLSISLRTDDAMTEQGL